MLRAPNSMITMVRNAVCDKDMDGDGARPLCAEAPSLKSQLCGNGANRSCDAVAEVSTAAGEMSLMPLWHTWPYDDLLSVMKSLLSKITGNNLKGIEIPHVSDGVGSIAS